MSGIFGLVRFGAREPDPAGWAAMAQAMNPWGDAPAARAELDGAAFGHLLRLETPEDVATQMPVAFADRGLLIACEGRLDNRSDVVADLGISAGDATGLADSTLMMHAYLSWGERCCSRLIGDWSLAAWHPREQRLVLARDHAGNTALFHHVDRTTGRVLFASDPRALVAAGVPRRLNEVRLAAGLVSWTGDDPESTIDLDITRIPPAHQIAITSDRLERHVYWSPIQPELAAGLTAEECARGLLAVLDTAVQARCRSVGSVATTLSGGLDSGSVSVLAARALPALGSGDRLLTAYTHVPISDTSDTVGLGRFGDETVLASASAHAAGIAQQWFLDSADITPMEGIERSLATLDQPTHAASNAFWINDVLRRAADAGHRTMLTGQGGNATISWTGRPGSTTLAGRWRERGLRGVLGYLAPSPIHRRHVAHLLDRMEWQNTSIEPDFAKRIALSSRFADSIGTGSVPAPRARALDLRTAISQPTASRIGDLWSTNSAYHGLDVRDPTLDPRVIAFTFAIPDRMFHGPNGMDRWVLREAMSGLLPDEVRLNDRRGLQSADLVERLRRSAEQVDAALDEVDGSGAEQYLSTTRMRAAWQVAQQASDPMTTHRSGSILLRGVMAALWIKRTYG